MLIPLGILAGAGGAASSYESIASATGTGSSGTIIFGSIPATYVSLQIRCNLIDSGGNSIRFRFNSDTGNNYAFHYLHGAGASGVGAGGVASTSRIQIENVYGSSNTYPIGLIADIYDYASTSKYKTLRCLSGWDANGAGLIELASGLWQSTSAINSITIESTGGANFSNTSQFALYGIKG
jgi:hypothetical protein